MVSLRNIFLIVPVAPGMSLVELLRSGVAGAEGGAEGAKPVVSLVGIAIPAGASTAQHSTNVV